MPPSSDPNATSDEATVSMTGAVDAGPREFAASPRHFRVIRLHAEGGLGAVYLAEDVELGREVALKELLPHRALTPASRDQFLGEAELTSRLEHPGIVPVYSMGEHADGRPYYVMRFARGGSLAEAIRRFHDGGTAWHGREFRRLLGCFVSVCNAIAFAHSRGVIHCDLKPSNILLGEFGETLVVDWGLAKTTQECLAGPEHRPALFGTPAYFAPEQALSEPITPATDVYSLGATLYAMLTGQEPHRGGSQERIRQAVTGEFARPRQVRPAVPRPLEAVCLKAMALTPAERYASPLALAADIEQWLADEPVSCHRDSMGVRSWRWARRNRTKVAALMALVATALIALLVGIVAVNRERGRTVRERDDKKAALAAAQLSEKRALSARRRTRDTLDVLSSSLIEDWLAKQTRFDREQLAFLERALASYDAFAAEGGDDPESWLAVSDAYNRAGAIRQRLGQATEAEADFRRSRDVLARLAEQHPERLDVRATIASRDSSRGWSLFQAGKPVEAEAVLRSALAAYEQLRPGTSPGLTFLHQEARVKTNLGVLLQAQSRPQEAETLFREARDLFARLKVSHPGLYFDDDISAVLLNLGKLLTTAGRFDEGEQVYSEGLELRRQMVSATPRDLRNRQSLANLYNNMAILMRVSNRAPKAEPSYREAIRLLQELADEYPAVPSYRFDLANARDNLAITLVALNQLTEAERLYRSALADKLRLISAFPNQPDYVVSACGNRCNLANLLSAVGRSDDASTEYGLAIQALDAVREKNPANADAREFLINSLIGRALLRDKHRQHAGASADWGRVIALLGPAAGMNFRMRRALALARGGASQVAIAEVAPLMTAPQMPPPGMWDVARLHALAGPRHAADAVAMLRRANKSGFFVKPEILLTESDLDAIRMEAEFRTWMAEMKLPAPESLPMPRP